MLFVTIIHLHCPLHTTLFFQVLGPIAIHKSYIDIFSSLRIAEYLNFWEIIEVASYTYYC